MLKFLESRDEAMDLVHTLAKCPELSSFKLGLAGSFVTGLNKKASAIDIVLKLKDGESKDLIGDLDICYYIHHYMATSHSNKIKVIWLDMLEKDDESLLEFMAEEGVEHNPESAYTNIVGEICWVDDEDDSDDDRISSSVMTWDEDENDEVEVSKEDE